MAEKVTSEKAATRRVAEVLPSKDGLLQLMKRRKIRLYLGVDPTSPDLHLGHAVQLRKLREFQELGHQVILLFGTFTGLVGDPSGKDKQRKPLEAKQIKKNMATYKKQAAKFLDFKKVKVVSNGDWLGKMKFEEVLRLASHFTAAQLMERDMYQKRGKKGQEVWMSELLYPLMQGYDSVAMDVDLEIGGTDQTFNMLVGRRLQKLYNDKEKFVLTTPLLLGLDGKKMSKTYGNTVNLLDPPKDMYGKLMSMRDELLVPYFELACEYSESEVKKKEEKLQEGSLSPLQAKKELAYDIVSFYHGEKKADKARDEFVRIFRDKQQPLDIPGVKHPEGRMGLAALLAKTKLAPSKSEARRLIEQGGVKVDGRVQKETEINIQVKKGIVIQVGKKRFIQII